MTSLPIPGLDPLKLNVRVVETAGEEPRLAVVSTYSNPNPLAGSLARLIGPTLSDRAQERFWTGDIEESVRAAAEGTTWADVAEVAAEVCSREAAGIERQLEFYGVRALAAQLAVMSSDARENWLALVVQGGDPVALAESVHAATDTDPGRA